MNRLDYLTLLIYAGWGEVPQCRIPDDVLASAERGAFPRVAPEAMYDLERELKPRPAPIVIDEQPKPEPPKRWSVADQIRAKWAAKRERTRRWMAS